MRYYRFGGEPYQYEYNWQGMPMAPSKAPLMTLGQSMMEKKVIVPLAVVAGVYFLFVRKGAPGKAWLSKLTKG